MTDRQFPSRERRAGQAMVEYLLGVAVLVTLLTMPLVDGRSGAEALMEVLRERYVVLSTWLALI